MNAVSKHSSVSSPPAPIKVGRICFPGNGSSSNIIFQTPVLFITSCCQTPFSSSCFSSLHFKSPSSICWFSVPSPLPFFLLSFQFHYSWSPVMWNSVWCWKVYLMFAIFQQWWPVVAFHCRFTEKLVIFPRILSSWDQSDGDLFTVSSFVKGNLNLRLNGRLGSVFVLCSSAKTCLILIVTLANTRSLDDIQDLCWVNNQNSYRVLP